MSTQLIALLMFLLLTYLLFRRPASAALRRSPVEFHKLTEGVLMRGEWRRDFSGRPFFLTSAPGVLKKDQNTATLGLVWWFGKESGW